MATSNGIDHKPPFSIDRWLSETHCGIRGIWIAMFVLGVALIVIGEALK